MRILALCFASLIAVSACTTAPSTSTPVSTSGTPLPQRYVIRASDAGKIQFRMLDSVNALRQASGLNPLRLNAALNAAAATHSRDMSLQNRPWHFGSDGSSPIQRVQRAGYPLTMLGENISETFETEVVTLAAWMEQSDTRSVVMDPEGRDLGFAWFQEPGGKIWWTMLVGGGDPAIVPEHAAPGATVIPTAPIVPEDEPESEDLLLAQG